MSAKIESFAIKIRFVFDMKKQNSEEAKVCAQVKLCVWIGLDDGCDKNKVPKLWNVD